MKYKLIQSIIIFMGLLLGLVSINTAAWATFYPKPDKQQKLYGHLQITRVGQQSLVDIMKRYDVGYRELQAANPQKDLQHLKSQQRLIIPTMKLLPQAPQKGIVVNLASMRLYYFRKQADYFETYPVGIGKQGQKTPLGDTHIVAKQKNPQWRPTSEVRHNFLKENGYPLPPVVMPGPDNPLGQYKLRLGWQAYLIHGTSEPHTIGTRTSAGCIHLFNRDVGFLYRQVPLHTPVKVVYQPYIAAWQNNNLYLQAYHPIAQSYQTPDYKQVIKRALSKKHGNVQVDWDEAQKVADQGLGVPLVIGYVTDKTST